MKILSLFHRIIINLVMSLTKNPKTKNGEDIMVLNMIKTNLHSTKVMKVEEKITMAIKMKAGKINNIILKRKEKTNMVIKMRAGDNQKIKGNRCYKMKRIIIKT